MSTGLASMVYRFLDKKAGDTNTYTKARNIPENQQLAKVINYTRPFKKNFRTARYTHHVKITFGELNLKTCS